MSVIPDTRNGQIEFAEQHATVWATTFAAIGLTTEQCTAITTAATAARTSYSSAQALRLSAKAATYKAEKDIEALRTLVTEAVMTIRLYAQTTKNPGVFAKAQIPPPASRTPAKPPTQPVELRAVIGTLGQLTIMWRPAASSPGFNNSTSGVLYTVRRKLPGETAFSYIGAAKPARSGARGFTSFIDDTLPAGAGVGGGVQYVVQGVRSVGRAGELDLTGPASDVLSVTLGSGGAAGSTVLAQSTGPDPTIKLAA